tara:strand:+ start:327 stop:815 length:489 start_codon:yes stop_codon:yes gene_type:complete
MAIINGPNTPVSKKAFYSDYTGARDMGEQSNDLLTRSFLTEMLEHFRDKGVGTNLGLEKSSGWNPSSPQSETFLRLLTQPEALQDMFNVDRKIGDKVYLGGDTGNLGKQQDAIMAAVDALLNTKMDKSQTGKYAYDESRLPYEMEGTWKDVNILDVIKKLGK